MTIIELYISKNKILHFSLFSKAPNKGFFILNCNFGPIKCKNKFSLVLLNKVIYYK